MKGKLVRFEVLAIVLLGVMMFVALPQSVRAACGSGADYRSVVVSGTWANASTWECFNGTTWESAVSAPGNSNSVFVQSGHTVTLSQNESVNDLNISMGTSGSGSSCTGTIGTLALATNTLQVNGKLRGYSAVVGTTPGTDCQARSTPITMTAGSGGKISIVGDSRNITTSNQWSAANTGSSTTFAIEINMNNGQTATMGTSIKASSWNIVAGTLDASTFRIAADTGVATGSDIVVALGATVRSSATGTGTSAVAGRTTNGLGGTLTVNGTLILNGAAPTIGMTTVNLNGTVEYCATGNQILATAINSGANPSTYANITLSGSGTKTLGLNTTVNGTLSMAGTASLALSTFTLTYGGSSVLEYTGSGAQTTSNTEFPASGGPNSLTINNANGVSLGADRTINGTLALTSGDLDATGKVLTLGGNSVTGAGDVIGTVRRVSPGTGTGLLFNNASTMITFSTAPTQMDVTLTKSAPSTPTLDRAIKRYYTLSPNGSATATIQLAYNPTNDVPAFPYVEANTVLWRNNGSQWVYQGGVLDTSRTDFHWVTLSGVSNFSDWALTDNGGPTAVTLSSFSAQTDEPPIMSGLAVLGTLLAVGAGTRRMRKHHL